MAQSHHQTELRAIIMSNLIANTRRKNYWEPIYSTEYISPEGSFSWDTKIQDGVKDCTCTADALGAIMKAHNKEKWVLRGISFTRCDFSGSFSFEQIVFTGCKFEACDFGNSNWNNAKFSNCKFSRCSLTQTTFDKCQFNDCSWFEISFSGTETRIFNTFISNPGEFISAGYTNLNADQYPKGQNVTVAYQKMRLEETKAKVARFILRNNEQNGDDASYYKAIESYLLQTVKSRRESKIYEIGLKNKWYHTLPLAKIAHALWYDFEIFILRISGSINGWGSSIAKPFFVGLALMMLFALTYYLLEPQNTTAVLFYQIINALIKSFDITLLFGYTKHASNQSAICIQIIFGINALFGLWWYSILVPTVINRISRVR